jgi:hypothetical protein
MRDASASANLPVDHQHSQSAGDYVPGWIMLRGIVKDLRNRAFDLRDGMPGGSVADSD